MAAFCVRAGVHDAAFSPDGKLLAAACRDGRLRVFDVSSGAIVAGKRHPSLKFRLFGG